MDPSAPGLPAAQPPPYTETSGKHSSASYSYPYPVPAAEPGSTVRGQQAPLYGMHPGAMGTHPQTFYVHVPLIFHEHPVLINCPVCQRTVLTSISHTPGLLTWLACSGLFLLGCAAGCCLIPFCVDLFRDVDHYCPSCSAYIGTYKRL